MSSNDGVSNMFDGLPNHHHTNKHHHHHHHDTTTTTQQQQQLLVPLSKKRQQQSYVQAPPVSQRRWILLIVMIGFLLISFLITIYQFDIYIFSVNNTTTSTKMMTTFNNNSLVTITKQQYQQLLLLQSNVTNCSCTNDTSSSLSLKPCSNETKMIIINNNNTMGITQDNDNIDNESQHTTITPPPTPTPSDMPFQTNDNLDHDPTPMELQQQGQEQQRKTKRYKLRLNWTKLQRYSILSKQIADMQNDCSITKKGNFWHRNKSGLGSDLHYYSRAICNALELKYYPKQLSYTNDNDSPNKPIITHLNTIYSNIPILPPVRIRTIGNWTWKSLQHCTQLDPNNRTIQLSAMKCYFPQSELQCPDDFNTNDDVSIPDTSNNNNNNNKNDPSGTRMLLDGSNNDIDHMDQFNMTHKQGGITIDCPNVLNATNNSVPIIRAATTEFLFTRVSQLVQDEGERQLNLVFQNTTQLPKNLITVHLRWGDKIAEMKLSPISQYISAIQQILQQRIEKRNNQKSLSLKLMDTGYEPLTNEDDDIDIYDDSVNIFLCTEDPIALELFRNEAPDDWNIYIDQYYTEYLPYRQQKGDVYNVNVIAAAEMEGKTGLLALGSLLVAMEANDYVLTTKSNWSRLMNELRLNVVDPRCNGCTTMIDLSPSRGTNERV